MTLNELLHKQTLTVPGVGTLLAFGDTVPADGSKGYVQGALFMAQGAAWYESLWVNKGDVDSASFVVVNIV